MVEVFITNIKSENLAKEMLHLLECNYPPLKFNFDLEDFIKSYPCGHSILKVEGETFDTNSIVQQFKSKGMKCEVLADKICV